MITFNFWVWWLPPFLFYLITQALILSTAAAYAFFEEAEPPWLTNIVNFFIKMNVPILAINLTGVAAFALEWFAYGG